MSARYNYAYDDTNDSQQADTDFHLKGKVILVAEVRRKRKQISLSVRISFIYTWLDSPFLFLLQICFCF